MTTKYEPGTVAKVTVSVIVDPTVLAFRDSDHSWRDAGGYTWWDTQDIWRREGRGDDGTGRGFVLDVHPLLVVDPQDDALTGALHWAAKDTPRLFRERLAEFANQTPPVEEPEGIGAVVHASTREDGPRRIFVSHHPDNDDDRTRWVDVDGDWHGWVNLLNPEVLSEGYTPEAK